MQPSQSEALSALHLMRAHRLDAAVKGFGHVASAEEGSPATPQASALVRRPILGGA